MGLHHVGSIEARPGARATGNRFIVLVLRIAECEVVHGSLRSSHDAERAVKRVGDAL